MAHSNEVIAQHDYAAVDEQELTLRKGDVIGCVERRPGGWWRGELRGKVGLFPDNFVRAAAGDGAQDVQSRHDAGAPRFCRAVFSYAQANPDELNLAVGDVIQVLGEVEEGWWRGQKGKQLGVFPSNFVVEVTPPLPPKPVREQCRVLYPYTAANSDELTLTEGDVLTIISKDVPDQGWWRGELRGKIGLFPDNFVQVIASSGSNATPIDDDQNKKPVRPAKNISTLNQLKNSSLTSSKKEPKPNSTENIAAVRKSLEISDFDKKKLSDSTENIIDAGKSRKSFENEKARRSMESDGNKPPVPLKKAGSPVVAMLSELRQKVLSSDRSGTSPQSTDSADGLTSSKLSGEPILKSISPSPSPVPPGANVSGSEAMAESFDRVERGSILNDPRSGRDRGPPRRPPSQAIRDDQVILTNGSSHNSSTESAGDVEIKPKAREWEKQKAPWMEELKFNQAKKVSPITELGRSKTISAPESAADKVGLAQSKLSGSTDKMLDEGAPVKDMPTLNPLEMSQSMSSLSSRNIKLETSVEASDRSENPLDFAKSMTSLSSRSTHLESNNKFAPNELRTSISSSASVVMRSTTHAPGNTVTPSLRSFVDPAKKVNVNDDRPNSNGAVNGLPNSELTPDQMLIAQLNERVANLECLVEAQEARFAAALDSLGAKLAKEVELRLSLQAEIQKLERCVTRV